MVTAVVNARPRTTRWNTLRTLKGLCGATLLLDGLLLLVVTGAARQHQTTVHTLAERAAPGSFAARRIEAAVTAMDAAASHELLLPPGEGHSAAQAYDAERTGAVRALISTAESLQGDQAATEQVETLEVGLGEYERLLQQARDLHDHGDDAAAVKTYADAAQVAEAKLLPAAKKLADGREDAVESLYQVQQMHSVESRFALLALLTVQAFGLGAAQLYLSRRTHRTFNLPLLAAMLGVVAVGGHFVASLASEQAQLGLAKHDLYDHLDRLGSIRLAASRIYDEQGQHLLRSASGAPALREQLAAEQGRVATLPSGMSLGQVIDALGNGRGVDGFTGLLPEELDHAAAPGERDAVVELLPAWGRFLAATSDALQAEQSRNRARAVALSTGDGAGAVPVAIRSLNRGLDAVQTLDEDALYTSLQRAGSGDGRLTAEAWLTCLVLASLVIFGFTPRIREYL